MSVTTRARPRLGAAADSDDFDWERLSPVVPRDEVDAIGPGRGGKAPVRWCVPVTQRRRHQPLDGPARARRPHEHHLRPDWRSRSAPSTDMCPAQRSPTTAQLAIALLVARAIVLPQRRRSVTSNRPVSRVTFPLTSRSRVLGVHRQHGHQTARNETCPRNSSCRRCSSRPSTCGRSSSCTLTATFEGGRFFGRKPYRARKPSSHST